MMYYPACMWGPQALQSNPLLKGMKESVAYTQQGVQLFSIYFSNLTSEPQLSGKKKKVQREQNDEYMQSGK